MTDTCPRTRSGSNSAAAPGSLVGSELPDVPAANAVASRWKELAETRPDELHETIRGSGVVVRGSAIIAIKAQAEPKPSSLGSTDQDPARRQLAVAAAIRRRKAVRAPPTSARTALATLR